MIFSSPPASSSINSTPTGRTLMTAPGTMARVLTISTSQGSPSSDKRVRDEAVIARIAHRRVEEAVDDQRAGFLVQFVFDRLAADRHFDDDIDVVRRIYADRDRVDTHGNLRDGRSSRAGQLLRVMRGPGLRIHRLSRIVQFADCAAPGALCVRRPSGASSPSVQLVQANATLSSDLGPNFSEERATMRPPSAR